MEQKTKHICKCGARGGVEELDTGAWFCLECALAEMLEDIRLGDSVKVSFGNSGIGDVFVIPGDDRHESDLLAPLVGAVAISFCRN